MLDVFSLEGTEQPHKEENKDIITVGLDKDIMLKKMEIERLTDVYENIKVSERLRAKINKDIAAGEPMEGILKDCLKCISLMTGDTVFYEQNIKKIKI